MPLRGASDAAHRGASVAAASRLGAIQRCFVPWKLPACFVPAASGRPSDSGGAHTLPMVVRGASDSPDPGRSHLVAETRTGIALCRAIPTNAVTPTALSTSRLVGLPTNLGSPSPSASPQQWAIEIVPRATSATALATARIAPRAGLDLHQLVVGDVEGGKVVGMHERSIRRRPLSHRHQVLPPRVVVLPHTAAREQERVLVVWSLDGREAGESSSISSASASSRRWSAGHPRSPTR